MRTTMKSGFLIVAPDDAEDMTARIWMSIRDCLARAAETQEDDRHSLVRQ